MRAREVLFVGTVSLRKFGTTTCGSSRPARWKRSASRRRRSRSRCMARTAGSTKKKRCWRTVLLVRDVNELQFDVKAHRCIVYSSIKDLEAKLKAELATL
ncbi:MAG: hypothetical protein DI536_08490 [Archangium gephyra]|uniref:Uncharacterized protein n=1 Tax=Archangium gephyra TaxID=48 RepID=A0A2W5TSI5_9BACT|nr:MAG: hypothetical protein DI536_08490 [Archangium gephyra]